MALSVGGAGVVLVVGVEVGAGRGAAAREVTELVDVEAALGVGVEALKLGLAGGEVGWRFRCGWEGTEAMKEGGWKESDSYPAAQRN